MRILAIESSCDECSAALLDEGKLLSVCTRTQTVHQQYGGVVPELAGRSHLEWIDSVVLEAMTDAGATISSIDLVASTIGPGLIGSLLVGANYARGLAVSLEKPFWGIHHVEAHLWSSELTMGRMPVPFLVLLVSGGHTILIRVDGLRRYKILGETLDDALGEAYDKVGKLIGLSFPAGAEVDRLASTGSETAYAFPEPMNDGSCHFSFSGLKTAFLYKMRSIPETELVSRIPDLLASFQSAALNSVIRKLRTAAKISPTRALVAAGGVAANSSLRKRLSELAGELGISAYFPALKYCGDNAAMIGHLAWKLHEAGIECDSGLLVRPRWPMENLGKQTSE